MGFNMGCNSLDLNYNKIIDIILKKGIKKSDRTGTGTIATFGHLFEHEMEDGFPLLTGKKMFHRGIVEELLWFLRGETNIKSLVEKKVNIWNGDAYAKYKKTLEISEHIGLNESNFIESIKTDLHFAEQWGELGPIYGAQWRDYNSDGIDQISNLIHDLKVNPDSRRLMVTAWNPSKISEMTLPPCHYGFQCFTRELTLDERNKLYFNADDKRCMAYLSHKYFDRYNVPKRALSLMWDQRSVDSLLGLPFNIASYGFLLHMLAKIMNMIPENLKGSLKDTHLYTNHVEQAREQLSRENIYSLPTLSLGGEFRNVDSYWDGDKFKLDQFLGKITSDNFNLQNYKSHATIKAPLSN